MDLNDLDLVKVGEKDNLQICKIMDYSKTSYKKQKETKNKNQTKQKIKEIRFTTAIAEHDVLTKTKFINRFLEEGDKVKITIRLNRRNIFSRADIENMVDRFLSNVQQGFVKDEKPQVGERNYSITISPNKKC